MNSVVNTFTMGSNVLDQQLGCLWQKDHLLSISLSGYINYLDKNNPSKPLRVIKVRLHWALSVGATRKRGVRPARKGQQQVRESWRLALGGFVGMAGCWLLFECEYSRGGRPGTEFPLSYYKSLGPGGSGQGPLPLLSGVIVMS